MSTRANMLLERVRWGVSMSALEIQNQDKNEGSTPQVTNFHKLKEERQMKPTMNMTTRRLSVSKGFSAGTLWRVARVVAAGALLAGGTALYFNMASGSQAGSPSSIEKMEVAPYWVQRDEAEEMTYDELSKNFIGIPSPSDNQVKSPLLIMEEQRAADRQADLQDMIQYWNQLKKDEATCSASLLC